MGGSGSIFDNILNALAGRGYADGSTWTQRPQTQPDGPPMPTGSGMDTISPQQYHHELAMAQQNMRPSPQPQQAPQAGPFSGFGPMGQQPGMQASAFVPPPPSQMQGRMIPPAQAGYSAPMIQQPIPGSAPVVAQGFHSRGFSPQPTLADLLMMRRGA